MGKIKTNIGTYISLAIITILSIVVILPYFHKGFFPTHDGEWAVVRLSDMFRELRDLQIPPRYSGNLNFGFGYPLFNFAYPFPYYLGIILHFLKFSFVDSIKTLFAVSVPLSAIFMFFTARKLWNSTISAFASSLLYIYFPYRFVDLYVRGSIGESLSFVLFPAIFFFMVRLLDGSKSKRDISIFALLFGALVMTHNIMAVFFGIILIFFLLCEILPNFKNVLNVLIAVFSGAMVSAFFWMPALLEKHNILLSKIPIADRNLYYVNFNQLLFSPWGYGTPADQNAFTYQIGLPQIVVFLIMAIFIAFIIFAKKKLEFNHIFTRASALFSITVLFIFMLFSISSFLWELPLLSEINYPWTLLGPIGFLTALMGGFLAKQKQFTYFVIFICIAAVLLTYPYAKPRYYVNRGDDFYVTNEATTTSSNELMPLWVKEFPAMRASNKVEIISGSGSLNSLFYNSKKVQFDTNSAVPVRAQINVIYYPGWIAQVDKKNVPIKFNNKYGVMEINIPKGNHSVMFSFKETQMRLFADALSVASLFTVCGLIMMKPKRKDRL